MRLIIPFLLFISLFANNLQKEESKLVNCYKIFDQRKGELEMQVEQIQEQQQAFQALKDASMNILKKKEAKIKKMQTEVNATLAKIETTKKSNEELLKKYQQILAQIKSATTSKLVISYAKMRAGNAANIISALDTNTSLEILSKLSPKVLSKIFAKMDPQKAAFLTEKLKNFIPKGQK